jgi:hypothetical protein
MRAQLSAVALCASALLATPAAAQQYAAATTPTAHVGVATLSDAEYRSAIGPMRSDLRNLLMAQEMYWSANKTYATDVSALTAFHSSAGAEIQIVRARADGWTARAVLPGSGGRTCVIWTGNVVSGERLVTETERKSFPEAEVSCDGDGLSAHSEWASAEQSYMTFALRTLERSQEKYRALNGSFAPNSNQLDQFVWDQGVSVTILNATADGYAARATFAGVPGKSCVIWRGDLPQTSVPHTDENALSGDRDQVVCDRM